MTPAARAIEIDAARPWARAGRARGVSPPLPLLAAALFASAVVLSPIGSPSLGAARNLGSARNSSNILI